MGNVAYVQEDGFSQLVLLRHIGLGPLQRLDDVQVAISCCVVRSCAHARAKQSAGLGLCARARESVTAEGKMCSCVHEIENRRASRRK